MLVTFSYDVYLFFFVCLLHFLCFQCCGDEILVQIEKKKLAKKLMSRVFFFLFFKNAILSLVVLFLAVCLCLVCSYNTFEQFLEIGRAAARADVHWRR